MPNFSTVPTELLEHAECVYSHYSNLGYSIKIEPSELHFPSCPALVCKRNHTQLAVIVCNRIDIALIDTWVSLAASMSTDFQVAICISTASMQKYLNKYLLKLKQNGVGILVSSNNSINILNAPVDLGIRIQLPDINILSRANKRILGPAYEHIQGGRWRDGFDEACRALEQQVRPYFKKALDTGRLNVYNDAGLVKNPTKTRLGKLTLGQLAIEIGNARPLNGVDSKIQKALSSINADRVNATHKNKRSLTEKNLRKNVGQHMHVIVQALRELDK
jgi:hypothetical protein